MIGPLALAYFGLLMLMLLYPFDFSRPHQKLSNGVEWFRDPDGIEFRSPGLVRGYKPPGQLRDAVAAGEGLTVEAWLTTTHGDQAGPARIVSYSRGIDRRNFTLGQADDGIAFRLRTGNTTPNGTEPEHHAPGILRPGLIQHVVVTYRNGSETIYVDGSAASTSRDRTGRLDSWDPSCLLLLGNESTGTRPWIGRLHLVALYDRPLSPSEVVRNHRAGLADLGAPSNRTRNGLLALYRFSAGGRDRISDEAGALTSLDLEIPGSFLERKRGFFARSVWTESSSSLLDRLVNVAIFVPLGFLVDAAVSARRSRIVAALVALGAGLALTTSAEAAQYWIESRESSVSDVTHNVAGTGLGVALRALQGWTGRFLPTRSRP